MSFFDDSSSYACGEIVYKRPTTYGPRVQADLQLVYVQSGEMVCVVDGVQTQVRAGEACLLLPGHKELFYFGRGRPTRHGWCALEKPRLAESTRARLMALPRVIPFGPRLRALAALLRPVLWAQDGTARARRAALGQALLHEYLADAGYFAAAEPPLNVAVARACAWLDKHLAEPVDLASLARHSGVSPGHLIRLFRRSLGLTPARHLWKLRITQAERLLKETALSVAEIAHQTGFANPQHFSRLFRQYRGIPPGKARAQESGGKVRGPLPISTLQSKFAHARLDPLA